MESQERRTTQRIQLNARVTLYIDDQIIQAESTLRDISLDGLNVTIDHTLPPHQICRLEITISGPSSDLTLRTKGRILRQQGRAVAIKFTELDVDSYQHLKHVIVSHRTPGSL